MRKYLFIAIFENNVKLKKIDKQKKTQMRPCDFVSNLVIRLLSWINEPHQLIYNHDANITLYRTKSCFWNTIRVVTFKETNILYLFSALDKLNKN